MIDMAKRIFNSDKFRDAFYRLLPPEMKCCYEYLQCECDYAGIIDIDIGDLNFKIGTNNVTLQDIKEYFGEKILILNEAQNKLKIFLPKFIYWQYKNELTPNNKVHRHVYDILCREGIQTQQFLAPKVLDEDFLYWEDLCKWMKENNTNYKDVLKDRV